MPMRLTLLRHGKAEDREAWEGEDADRPLTRKGVAQVERLLRSLRPALPATEVWTSPLLRARQTAELASAAWKLPLVEQAWLAPGAEVAAWAGRLDPRVDVLLVGHEPELGQAIALLTGGAAVPLRKAGIAVLKGDPLPGSMRLELLLAPKAALAIADG